MYHPKLSIIIPVYNVEDYVGFCLYSIFESKNIDPHNFEIIIVNDGTLDNSMEVIRKASEGHDNIIIIEQENQGLSAARMAGLTKASGQYVWFIDSDDWISDFALSQIFHVIELDPEIDVIVSPLLWQKNEREPGKKDIIIENNLYESGKGLLQSGRFPLWAAVRYIFKIDFADNPHLFFPKGLLHEDEYFYRVLLFSANRIYCLKDPLYHYRQRPDSIMGRFSIRSSYDIISIYRLLKTYLNQVVERADYRWFQQDITSFLLNSFRKNLLIAGTAEFRRFQRENARYIWVECMKCKGFSIKERLWISFFLIFPRLFAKRKAIINSTTFYSA